MKNGSQLFLIFFFLAIVQSLRSSTAESLDQLANDFWSWRAKYAPFTADDVNRIERPGGVRDWSAAAIVYVNVTKRF